MSAWGRSPSPAAALIGLALAASAVAALAVGAKRRFMRFEVAGSSMVPALDPGDFVIVERSSYRRRLPRRGEVVLARDPRDAGRVLVKRVEHVDLHGGIWLAGDNAAESTDSRSFGSVSVPAILGRVRWRYWPPRSLLRVR